VPTDHKHIPSGVIYHEYGRLHTKFEMPSFTGFKDMIRAPEFKNGSRESD